MIRAARLDPHLYEEVEVDRRATVQAMSVVILVALATGIGSLAVEGGGAGALLKGVLLGLVGWALWAFVTYAIGTSLFRTPETEADWGQLARTTGFAQSPGALRIFGFLPVIGPVIFFASTMWQLAAMVVAVRQALDYQSTWRALGVVAVGFVCLVILQIIFYALR